MLNFLLPCFDEIYNLLDEFRFDFTANKGGWRHLAVCGLAKERPYPGSTTITTINGGVTSMVRTLALELAPLRVNALHPAANDIDAETVRGYTRLS